MQTKDFILKDGTPWRLYTPEKTKKDWAVLWLQGFTSTIEGHDEGIRRMSKTSALPFAALNYAGHGNNPTPLEKATRAQQLEEVLTVYDELAKRFTKIVVIGGSFGGYMAALLANERQPKVIVLRAPAQYNDDEFELPLRETSHGRKDREMYLYRQAIDSNFTNKAVEGIKNFSGDVYVIENEEDKVVNRSIPQSYYNAARHGNYIVIPGLKHSPKLMSNSSEYYEVIEKWIEAILLTVTKELR